MTSHAHAHTKSLKSIRVELCCVRSKKAKQMDEEFAESGNENSFKQRNHAGPLPRTLHDLFMRCVRARASATLPRWQCPWPSGPDLKSAGFAKPKGGHTRREKFKNWAERMDIRFDSDSNAEVLVYKRTGKIIVPVEEFESVVRKVHSRKHFDLKKTFSLIQEKYTVGNRDFGIDKNVINFVVETCPECLMQSRCLSNGIKHTDTKNCVENGRALSVVCNGALSADTRSMIAHMPDNKCMWFDKTVLGPSVDFNSKLHGLLNELRGEIGGTLRGSKDSKDRLLKKICIAQFVVREHKISTEPSMEIPEYNQKFIDDVRSLLESYRLQGKEERFSVDMALLVEAYRAAGYSDLFIESVEALVRSLMAR